MISAYFHNEVIRWPQNLHAFFDDQLLKFVDWKKARKKDHKDLKEFLFETWMLEDVNDILEISVYKCKFDQMKT